MKLQWNDEDQTIIRREVDEGIQFIPATQDNAVYMEEVLPFLEAGGTIAQPTAQPIAPNYVGFREAMSFTPEYERILNAIALQNPTRQTSVVQLWSNVENEASLQRAIKFWNAMVVPDATITKSESAVIQKLAREFGLSIVVADDGLLTVSNPQGQDGTGSN